MKPKHNNPDLFKLRYAHKLSQAQFWSAVGVTQSAGSRYETGRKMPTVVARLVRLVYIDGINIAAVNREELGMVAHLQKQYPDLYRRIKKEARIWSDKFKSRVILRNIQLDDKAGPDMAIPKPPKLNLRKLRAASGLSQQAFWAAVGVSQFSGARYELGKVMMPLPVALLLQVVYVHGISLNFDFSA
ncbi:MAG: hypothetical protein A2Z01_02700 [Betaproteobacteria bacterium RBG_16_58_11]|nr:MAG: hypothetical protein A2Z01_02700 [Betaproteobacteria bacterium RBG_16_58_11]